MKQIEWKDVKLGEVSKIGDGAHASIKRCEVGILYLTSKNFKQGKLDLSQIDFISEEDYQKHFKDSFKAVTKPTANDLLLNIIGSIGSPYIVKVGEQIAISSSVAIVRPTDNIVSLFLYYQLQSSWIQDYIDSIKSGAAQGFISIEVLKSIPIKLPPLSMQHQIAGILGKYDDLIANYEQQIHLLEQTAKELYREWFVRGRCPMGNEGWEKKPVADCFTIIGGGTPSKEEPTYWEEGTINWFTPTDITAKQGIFLQESSDKINATGLQNSSARLFPAYSVMMTSRATIGAVGINTQAATTNQGFIICLPNEVFSFAFIYFWIIHNKETFELLANGSTFLEISKGTFNSIEIMKPDDEVMIKFNKIVLPIFEQIENLQRQSATLRTTRDKLLPRLLRGDLLASA